MTFHVVDPWKDPTIVFAGLAIEINQFGRFVHIGGPRVFYLAVTAQVPAERLIAAFRAACEAARKKVPPDRSGRYGSRTSTARRRFVATVCEELNAMDFGQ